MSDKKSIATVIKTLERAIGILETSGDLGEFPDVTRKRIIEMLNSATMDIYFINVESDGKAVSTRNDFGHEPPEKQIELTNNILNEEIRSAQVVEIHDEDKNEIYEALNIDGDDKYISEDEIDNQIDEPIAELHHRSKNRISTEEDDSLLINEKYINSSYEEEDDVVENVADNFSDKPIFEWEENESDSKNELDNLKYQLDEERKRLEQELQNWQAEKQKREGEILAAKKLLEALQQQQASQAVKQQPDWKSEPIINNRMINNSQSVQENTPTVSKPQPQQLVNKPQSQSQSQQPVNKPQPQPQQPVNKPQPQSQQILNRQSQQFINKPQQQPQPQQVLNKQPQPVVNSVHAEKTQETLIDRFAPKKVLHENFETNVVNQISTPVSSLSKAIGINDRFRFIRELFGGDSDLYAETVKKLDKVGSLGNALSYIESSFSWDKNNDSVKQLISLVRRRYM
ncbi:MAG: hypothetical protein LBG92_12060 [Prevotellaceae bacterium]|jgi:hypothetical protein|nr:hypothetical protein [Prevotellaceae bacterium]